MADILLCALKTMSVQMFDKANRAKSWCAGMEAATQECKVGETRKCEREEDSEPFF